MNNPSDKSESRTLKTVETSFFFLSLPFFIMGLLLPVYGKELGATALEIGVIFSAFSVMTILMRPVVGWALDRFGRRPFYISGMLGYALTMVAFAYSDQIWGMVVARLLQGIASAFAWLSASAILADITGPENRARYFGRLAQASSRGSIIGAFIAFFLFNSGLSLNGWRISFLTFAAGAMIAFSDRPAGSYRKPSLKRPRPGQARSSGRGPGRCSCWSRSVTAASWAMTSPILILFLQDRLNAGVDVIAWAFLPSGIIWAVLPAHLGRLADRFGRKPLMILGLAVSAAAMFILPSVTNFIGLAVLWSVLALCFAAGDPAEQALVGDLTGGEPTRACLRPVCDGFRYWRCARAVGWRLAV